MQTTLGDLTRIAAHLDWKRVGVVFGVVLLLAAGLVLHHILDGVTWVEVSAALDRTSPRDVAGAALGTALSYAALVGYDALALHQVGARAVPLAVTTLTSFISHAFTFTLGFGLLTGGAVRLRLYTAAGVSAPDIVAVGLLCALTFWLGLAGLAGASLIAEPSFVTLIDGAPALLNAALGAGLLLAVGAYLAWTGTGRRTIRLGEWAVPLPGWRSNLVALLIGILDIAGAALTLWLLLPASADTEAAITFPLFLTVFILATVLGVASHAPGGLGVFEATILTALPSLPLAELIASLVLFRLVYYVAPFALASALLVAREMAQHRKFLVGTGRTAGRVARQLGGIMTGLLPQASAIVTFASGTVLVLSGTIPAEDHRLAALRHILPLPFVETSHLLASVIGVVLLVLATGLVRRLRTAWRGSVALLAAGALFSMAKGIDYEETTICLIGLGLLVTGRNAFYRRAGLFAEPPSRNLVLLTLGVLGTSTWLGFFVYDHVEYAPSLWWEFAYAGDAPRFLRATFAAAVTAVGIAVYALVHRSSGTAARPGPEAQARVQAIIKTSPKVDAQLARIGDKQFLLADTPGNGRDGFVMYGVQNRSFIAMGDPVATDPGLLPELVWRFKELADASGGIPVFYQVTVEQLPIYLDADFALVKLGEEAWVDLQRFTLQGSAGRKLRQAKSRAENQGATLSIVPAGPGVEAILAELRTVSDAWLGEKGQEKGFSLGFWTNDYMRCSDQAIVQHGDQIVAFANIWRSADRNEFAVDLMRHRPDAPGGVMDLLLVGLISQAAAEGFRWFGLGMAPLSGLSTHRLASRWSRLGALVHQRGDWFYQFEGLRAFKEKFKPEWRPRYLAYPGGFALPQVLLDITVLIARNPQRAMPDTELPVLGETKVTPLAHHSGS